MSLTSNILRKSFGGNEAVDVQPDELMKKLRSRRVFDLVKDKGEVIKAAPPLTITQKVGRALRESPITKPIVEGLFGIPETERFTFEPEDAGFVTQMKNRGLLGFLIPGITKTELQQVTDRYNNLLRDAGTPPERATKLAIQDVMDKGISIPNQRKLLPERIEPTGKESSILRRAGLFEIGEKGLDILTFGTFGKIGKPAIKKLVQSTTDDAVRTIIRKEFPKLPEVTDDFITALRVAKTEEEVTGILTRKISQSARILKGIKAAKIDEGVLLKVGEEVRFETMPGEFRVFRDEVKGELVQLRNLRTGGIVSMPRKTISERVIRAEVQIPKVIEKVEIPKVEVPVRAVTEIPPELKELAEEARKFRSAEEFVSSFPHPSSIPVMIERARESGDLRRIRILEYYDNLVSSRQKLVVSDIGRRVSAARDISNEVRQGGGVLKVNPDSSVIVYHGTSKEVADSIRKSGRLDEMTFFSHSKYRSLFGSEGARDYARLAGRGKGEIMEFRVDPRDISFNSGSGEIEAESFLVRGIDGVWSSGKRRIGKSTQSQLTDFYNQAVKGIKEVPKRTIGQVLPPETRVDIPLARRMVSPISQKQTPLKEEVIRELRNSEVIGSLPPSKHKEKVLSIGKEYAEYKKATEGIRGTWLSIREKVQDSFIRARKLQDKVIREGKEIPESANIDQARTLFDGRVGARLVELKSVASDIDKEIVRSVKKVGVPSDEFANDVNSFLHARHTFERNKALGDGAAGITNDEARKILKAIEELPHKNQVKKVAEQLQELNDQTLDILLDAEVISEDFHKTLRAKYKTHVPLQRIFEDTEEITTVLSGRGLDVRTTGIKRARGSDRPVADIFENIVANSEQAIIRAEKNRVDLTILNFARRNPKLGLFEEVIPPRIPVARETFEKDVDSILRANLVGFANKLKVSVEDVRRLEFRRGKAFGVFQQKGFGELEEKIIKTRFASSESTLAHELGHAIDSKIPGFRKLLNVDEYAKELDAVSLSRVKDITQVRPGFRDYLLSTEEKLAEVFSLYITDRNLAKKLAPKATKALDVFLREDEFLAPLSKFAPSNVNEILEFKETIFRPRPDILFRDPQILSMRLKGEPVFLKINDQRLALALKGVNVEHVPSLMRGISSFTRLYSGLHTRFNYEFALSNNIRDIQEMAVYMASRKEIGFGGAGKAVMKDVSSKKAVFDFIMGRDTEGAKLYKQMRLDGGTTGGLGLSTKEQVKADISQIRKLNRSKPRQAAEKVIQAVDKWNTIFEDATRLSVYRTSLDRGLTRGQAATLAKEATINFNKKGTAGPIINGLYMFSNASIQGSTKMLKAMKNPKVAGTVIASLGTVVYATNHWNDSVDKDWRDKVTKWDRSSNVVVVLPSDDGDFNYITIPVSWGLKPIKVALEYSYDLGTGRSGIWRATQGITTSFLEAYNPLAGDENLLNTLTPTILKTPFEISKNRNWFGNRIKPDFDPDLPESAKYFKSLSNTNTGKAFIKATEFLSDKSQGRIEISPADLDYAFKQYIGGAGKSISRLFSLISSIGEGEIEARERPILNRFLKNKNEDEVLESLFYEQIERENKQAARDKIEDTKRISPLYEEAQMLIKDGKNQEAQEIVDNLSDYDWEIYKKLKAADKRRNTKQEHIEMFKTVSEVRNLLADGKEDEARKVVDAMSDEEYETYNETKELLGYGDFNAAENARPDEFKNLEDGASFDDKPEGVIDMLGAYKDAFGTGDWITAFRVMFNEETLRKSKDGLIIITRNFEKTQKIRRELGATKEQELDHIVPLQFGLRLGGSNDKENLELIDKVY